MTSTRFSQGAGLILALVLGACTTLPREPFTSVEQAKAAPVGFESVRYTEDSPALAVLLLRALKPNANGAVDALALSGGGANGAYGAGLLRGWTLAGDRPTFQVVTGVSTGALIAPLVFAGPGWDDTLLKAYTGPAVRHLLRARGLMGLLTPGFFRRTPLRDLVRSYVTDDLLRAVARENNTGRRLLVATTNLDTGKLVVWDMGAIAARGGPESRALFIEVLVASASVPGVFPPTLIPVTAEGHDFAEMHVDGQTESAFFAFPPSLLLAAHRPGRALRLHLYIIVNGQTEVGFAVTPRSPLPILGRSFGVAAQASLREALISTAQFCEARDCEVRLSTLPESEKDDSLDFSAAHELSLLKAGEALAESGRAWRAVAAPPP